jgi:hypothetical protein
VIGRFRVVQRTLDRPQDPTRPQLRQPFVDRVVEPDLAFLHQDHGGDRRDRLGHGGEPEDRVSPHRLLAAEGHGADRLHVLSPAPVDERDEAGDLATFDMALEGEKPPLLIADDCFNVFPWLWA